MGPVSLLRFPYRWAPAMVVVNVAERNGGRLLLELLLDALRKGARARQAKSAFITVRILAAADLDGVCATKILVTLLQRDGIKYTTIPVTGNGEIVHNFGLLAEHPEVQHVVLLNCGGSLDIEEALRESNAPEHVQCFVVDAHRPVFLQNLSERQKRVVVFSDDSVGMGTETLAFEEEQEEDGESTVGETEAEDGEEGEETAERASERMERRRRKRLERENNQRRKRRRVNEYYLCTYYATPVAMSLFKLAIESGPMSTDLLWLAAISLTGYLDLGLISKSEYDRQAWEHLNEILEAIDNATTTPSKTKALRFEQELLLPFYKQWTLEESMNHSSYFYGTLELHRKKGQHALKAFMTTAGIPLKDFRQTFGMMRLPIQKRLREMFSTHGKEFGLMENKMLLHQFVRRLPDGPLGRSENVHLHDLGCFDAVRIMHALLNEVPANLNLVNAKTLPQNAEGELDMQAIIDMEREAMTENFFRVFDAVLCKDPQTLHMGIERALEEVKAVRTLAREIREERSMHATRDFRWCKVENAPHVFRHPLAVRRLAVWLLQVLFTYRPTGSAREKPLLVMVRDKLRDSYLMVGASPPKLAEQDEFAKRFRNALKFDKSIKYRYDFFDKSCIELEREDFDKFWTYLAA